MKHQPRSISRRPRARCFRRFLATPRLVLNFSFPWRSSFLRDLSVSRSLDESRSRFPNRVIPARNNVDAPVALSFFPFFFSFFSSSSSSRFLLRRAPNCFSLRFEKRTNQPPFSFHRIDLLRPGTSRATILSAGHDVKVFASEDLTGDSKVASTSSNIHREILPWTTRIDFSTQRRRFREPRVLSTFKHFVAKSAGEVAQDTRRINSFLDYRAGNRRKLPDLI